MLTSTGPLLPLCSSMIVSVRWPTSPPVASSFSCSAVRPARLSEPTISQFVPYPVPALSAGSASTRLSEVSTQTPNPTTASSRTSSRTRNVRPQRRGRRGARRSGRGGRAARREDGRAVRDTRGWPRRSASPRWAAAVVPAAGAAGYRGAGAGSGPPARPEAAGRAGAAAGREWRDGATAPRGLEGTPVVTAHAHHPASSARSRAASGSERYASARLGRGRASTPARGAAHQGPCRRALGGHERGPTAALAATRAGCNRGVDDRFDGFIAGLGTAAGLRVVVGHWPSSPFGAFTDVMAEPPDGTGAARAHRQVAAFVARHVPFDEVPRSRRAP